MRREFHARHSPCKIEYDDICEAALRGLLKNGSDGLRFPSSSGAAQQRGMVLEKFVAIDVAPSLPVQGVGADLSGARVAVRLRRRVKMPGMKSSERFSSMGNTALLISGKRKTHA